MVFDLDETLVHVNRGAHFKDSEQFVKVLKPNGTEVLVGFNIRPNVVEVLTDLKAHYNIVLMTASVEAYATKVLEVLDPDQTIFQTYVCKEHCLYYKNSKSVKDLSIFEEVEPGNIVLVDNFSSAFLNQLGNGVPILPYYGVITKVDDEMVKLGEFLRKVSRAQDVRGVIRKCFFTHLYVNARDIQRLIMVMREYLEKGMDQVEEGDLSSG